MYLLHFHVICQCCILWNISSFLLQATEDDVLEVLGESACEQQLYYYNQGVLPDRTSQTQHTIPQHSAVRNGLA